MMLGAPRQGRGARTPGVGGARDTPSAARGSPGGGARVPRASHTAAREATPASRAAAGSTAGGARAPGPLPPRARCSGQPDRRAPRGGRTPPGPGARQTQPRGARAPPGCRLSRLPGPGCQRLRPSKEPQVAGRRPHNTASPGAPGPRGRRPLAASSSQLPPRAVPAAAATEAAGAELMGWGGGRARPPPQRGRQASLRLNQCSGRGVPVPHPSLAQPHPAQQTPGSPEKKMREEDGPQGSGSSAPPVNKESQGEQDTTTCREQNSWDSPATPSSSQPCRRKFHLVPSRRGILLILV
nr:basic proline-rich protein-like [Manis javanica]